MPEKKKFTETDKRTPGRGKGDTFKKEKPAAGKFAKRDARDSRASERTGGGFKGKPAHGGDSDNRSFRRKTEDGGDRPFRGEKKSFDDRGPFKTRRSEDTDSRGARTRSEGGEDRPFTGRKKSFEEKGPFKARRNEDLDSKGSRKRFEGGGGKPFNDRKKSFEDRGSKTRRSEDADSRGFRKRHDEGEREERPAQRRQKDFDEGENERPSRRNSDTSDFRGRKKHDSDERPAPARNTRPSKGYGKDDDERDERPFSRERPDEKRFKSSRVGREYKPFQEFKERKGYKGKREDEEDTKSDEMPLNKYIAHSGECSRRDAAELVKQGKVKVNDVLILDPGHKVMRGDKITLSGKKLTLQKGLVYILLNKPKGYITTTDDEKGRRTVIDIVQDAAEGSRLFPVGRLDRNTTGLLLITNDGALAQKLSHPSFKAKKIYQVTLDKALTKADFDKVLSGVTLEDGEAHADALSYLEHKNELGIEIHSGKNRIVRRIFESMGYVVEKLDRMMYAGLTKKNLPRGKWRYLNEREIVLLKHFKS